MALQLEKTLSNGLTASYWRVRPEFAIDMANKKVRGIVDLYASKDARFNGSEWIQGESFPIDTDLDLAKVEQRDKLYEALLQMDTFKTAQSI